MKRARLEHPDRKENKDKGPGVSNDTVSLRDADMASMVGGW